MYKPTALTPAHAAPDLTLHALDGTLWNLAKNGGEKFTLLLFYRGLHCPKCRENLVEMEAALDAFKDAGTEIVAISMDPEDRAKESREEWQLNNLKLTYGLTVDQAKAWGLHISSGRGKTSSGHEETKTFNEPGTFLVRADGTLFASWVQTVPFARPKAADLLGMINFVNDKDYPPRGTLTDV